MSVHIHREAPAGEASNAFHDRFSLAWLAATADSTSVGQSRQCTTRNPRW